MKKEYKKYELPVDFRFKFNMLDSEDCVEEDCSKEEYREFRGEYSIYAYEKYLYTK